MTLFVVRNDLSFTRFVKHEWRYFLRRDIEGVKIVIRKNNTFIHIDRYYCVICNYLKYLQKHDRLEANKKSLEWLKQYPSY